MVSILTAVAPAADDALAPPLDQHISAANVVRAVQPGLAELASFDEAASSSRWQAAVERLAGHFAARAAPVIPDPRHPAIQPGDSTILLTATAAQRQAADEQWLKHLFTFRNDDTGEMETHDLGPEIQWLRNPSSFDGWMVRLHQMNLFAQLAGIHRDTGDSRYALEIGRLLLGWTRQCPHNISGHIRNGRPHSIDTHMQVRNRTCNALAAYDAIRTSPALTPEMHLAFWKLFLANCRYLLPWSSGRGGVTFPALIACSIYFPEFRESAEWLQAGTANLRENLVDRVTPDGAWDTYSVAYQTVCIPWALRMLELAQASPSGADALKPMVDVIQGQTGKMLEIMLWLTLPNGGTPCIGDIYGRSDWTSAYSATRLDWYLHGHVPEAVRERLRLTADPYDRLKRCLAQASGVWRSQPRLSSIGFPSTGYYAMRKSWEAEASPYLYVDVSPQARAHAHLDALHFELYAFGRPLLVDTGDYFLGWGDRTALHNTIEIDGKAQSRHCPVMPCEWFTSPGFDVLDGAHGGYLSEGVLHRRKILFVKNEQSGFSDYWILCDLVTGHGRHRVEQFFHFAGPTPTEAASVALHADSGAMSSAEAQAANIHIVPVPADHLAVGFAEARETAMDPKHKSSREAMLGWLVTGGTFRRIKSPVGVYSCEVDLPVAIYQVLFPTPSGAHVQIDIQRTPVTDGGVPLPPEEAVALKLNFALDRPERTDDETVAQPGQHGTGSRATAPGTSRGTTKAQGRRRMVSEWTDHVLLSHVGTGLRQYGSFQFDGELALVRENDDGRLTRILGTHGSRLQEQWDRIVSVESPVSYFDMQWAGQVVHVRCPSARGIRVWAQGAERVLREGVDLEARAYHGLLYVHSAWREPEPRLGRLRTDMRPQQQGLSGAQPYALITWDTDLPATSQVEFRADDGLLRRTVFDERLTTSHRARADFLRPGKTYTFTAVSACADGRYGTDTVVARAAGGQTP